MADGSSLAVADACHVVAAGGNTNQAEQDKMQAEPTHGILTFLVDPKLLNTCLDREIGSPFYQTSILCPEV
jgi:hypothetical protein